MAINTLLDYAQGEEQAFTDENARAQQDLTQARADLAAAQKDLADHTVERSTKQDEAAQIRRKIAETTVAADGKKLFEDLERTVARIRAENADVLDAAQRIAYAEARIESAQDELDRTAAKKADAKAEHEAEKERDKERTRLRNLVSGATLSGLPADADVGTAGPAKTAATDAEKRLNGDKGGDIPKKLFSHAEGRWKARSKRLETVDKAANDAEDTQAGEQAKGGLEGKASEAWLAFGRSERAVADFALTGKERYNRALAQLAAVKASMPLSADEAARLDELKTKGEAAIAKEVARDQELEKLEKALDKVEETRLAALKKDPTKDPEDDAAVQTARGDEQAARNALAPKQADYDAVKADLDVWEAAVPETTWGLFEDYEEALATLKELAGVKPGDLKSDATANEKGFAQALAARRSNERTLLALGAETKRRRERSAKARASERGLLIAALRGDD
jgi:hypothetical protein